jgi:hypothetical protein
VGCYYSARMSSRISKVFDLAQRGVVIGLFSYFGFQVYQISSKVHENKIDNPHMHSTYFEDVKAKVEEEYRKGEFESNFAEFYQEDDGTDNYLKNQVRPNLTNPEYLRQKQQEKRQQDGPS